MSDKEAKSGPGPLSQVLAIFQPFPQGHWSQMTSWGVLSSWVSSFFQRGTKTRQKDRYTLQAPGVKPLSQWEKAWKPVGLKNGTPTDIWTGPSSAHCGWVKGPRKASPHTHGVASSTASFWGKLPVERHLRPVFSDGRTPCLPG